MPFTTSVNLLSSSSGLLVSGYAPFTLCINPSGLILSQKLVKLCYNWGDGEIKPVSIFPSNQPNVKLPLSAEPGDPRNYPITHIYNTGNSSFNLQVCAYTIGNTIPAVWNISVKTQLPTNLSAVLQGFRLVEATMFGEEDHVLYFVESSNPQYLLPILIDWESKIPRIEPPTQAPLVLPIIP